jgi:hypothetical protein
MSSQATRLARLEAHHQQEEEVSPQKKRPKWTRERAREKVFRLMYAVNPESFTRTAPEWCAEYLERIDRANAYLQERQDRTTVKHLRLRTGTNRVRTLFTSVGNEADREAQPREPPAPAVPPTDPRCLCHPVHTLRVVRGTALCRGGGDHPRRPCARVPRAAARVGGRAPAHRTTRRPAG